MMQAGRQRNPNRSGRSSSRTASSSGSDRGSSEESSEQPPQVVGIHSDDGLAIRFPRRLLILAAAGDCDCGSRQCVVAGRWMLGFGEEQRAEQATVVEGQGSELLECRGDTLVQAQAGVSRLLVSSVGCSGVASPLWIAG